MYLYTHVHSSVIYNSQKAEETQMCTDRLMNKQTVLHTHNDYFSTLKQKEILTHAATWMNLEDTVLNEISQSQKDKQCSTYLRY